MVFMSTGMATTGVADIGNDITEPDATSPKLPHCILVVFGGENYGKYTRSLKRFAFIAIQYLLWLWTIPRNPKR